MSRKSQFYSADDFDDYDEEDDYYDEYDGPAQVRSCRQCLRNLGHAARWPVCWRE